MAYEPGAGDLSREYKFIKMKLTCCEGVSAFVLEKCVLISSMLIQNTLSEAGDGGVACFFGKNLHIPIHFLHKIEGTKCRYMGGLL